MRYGNSPTRRAFLAGAGALATVTVMRSDVFCSIGGKEQTVGFTRRGVEFAFDTGVIRGTLRAGGRSIGAFPLYYRGADRNLVQSYGVCSHYRLLDAHRRFGVAAWEWASTAELLADGSVKAVWSRDEAHPFDMEVTYRLTQPDAIDVVTTVKAARPLSKFEVFLASYFEGFTESFVCVRQQTNQADEVTFLKAEKTAGVWQMFPRDSQAVTVIQDGRWLHPPHPVRWAIMPEFACPVGIRRDPQANLVAIVMSRPEECFAVATPHSGEPHNSLYLSLFGRDVGQDETVTAHARLILAAALSDQEIMKRYREFAAG